METFSRNNQIDVFPKKNRVIKTLKKNGVKDCYGSIINYNSSFVGDVQSSTIMKKWNTYSSNLDSEYQKFLESKSKKDFFNKNIHTVSQKINQVDPVFKHIQVDPDVKIKDEIVENKADKDENNHQHNNVTTNQQKQTDNGFDCCDLLELRDSFQINDDENFEVPPNIYYDHALAFQNFSQSSYEDAEITIEENKFLLKEIGKSNINLPYGIMANTKEKETHKRSENYQENITVSYIERLEEDTDIMSRLSQLSCEIYSEDCADPEVGEKNDVTKNRNSPTNNKILVNQQETQIYYENEVSKTNGEIYNEDCAEPEFGEKNDVTKSRNSPTNNKTPVKQQEIQINYENEVSKTNGEICSEDYVEPEFGKKNGVTKNRNSPTNNKIPVKQQETQINCENEVSKTNGELHCEDCAKPEFTKKNDVTKRRYYPKFYRTPVKQLETQINYKNGISKTNKKMCKQNVGQLNRKESNNEMNHTVHFTKQRNQINNEVELLQSNNEICNQFYTEPVSKKTDNYMSNGYSQKYNEIPYRSMHRSIHLNNDQRLLPSKCIIKKHIQCTEPSNTKKINKKKNEFSQKSCEISLLQYNNHINKEYEQSKGGKYNEHGAEPLNTKKNDNRIENSQKNNKTPFIQHENQINNEQELLQSIDETNNEHGATPLNGMNNRSNKKNGYNHKNNYIPFTQQEYQINNENELLQSIDETNNEHGATPLNGMNNRSNKKNGYNHKNNYIPFTQQEYQINNENELLQSIDETNNEHGATPLNGMNNRSNKKNGYNHKKNDIPFTQQEYQKNNENELLQSIDETNNEHGATPLNGMNNRSNKKNGYNHKKNDIPFTQQEYQKNNENELLQSIDETNNEHGATPLNGMNNRSNKKNGYNHKNNYIPFTQQEYQINNENELLQSIDETNNEHGATPLNGMNNRSNKKNGYNHKNNYIPYTQQEYQINNENELLQSSSETFNKHCVELLNKKKSINVKNGYRLENNKMTAVHENQINNDQGQLQSNGEICNKHCTEPVIRKPNNLILFIEQENQINNERGLFKSNLFNNCVELSPCSKLNNREVKINVFDGLHKLSNSMKLEEENIHFTSLKNKSKNVKRYRCYICGATFTKELSLRTHLNISHNESKSFCCGYCKKVFRVKSHLITHVRIHTGEKPYKCEICQKSFTQQTNMITHMRIHSGNTPFKCTICKEKFNQKSLLEAHKWKHTGIKPFKCDICFRYFSRKSALNYHLKSHLAEKTYSCHLCEKVFYRKSYLDFHLKTHNNTNIGQCSICKLVFKYESTLKRHMKKHSMNKSVTRDKFKSGLSHKSSLLEHSNINTDEKIIESSAPKCPFRRENNLGLPVKSHLDSIVFKCNYCYKQFNKESIYKIHLKTHTEEKIFKCESCNKDFSSKSSLNSHLNVCKKNIHDIHIINKECMLKYSNEHSNEKYFNCNFCKKTFPSKISLILHKRKIHQNDSYKCDECKLAFFKKSKLINHLKHHLSEKVFQCQICKNTFTHEPGSKLHEKHFIQDKYLKMCNACCIIF